MASQKEKDERWKTFVEFERLVSEGKMTWSPCTLEELDDWGQCVIGRWLKIGIEKFEIGDMKVDGCYVLKIDDPLVQYIDVDPRFEFYNECYDDHHENHHPDVILAYHLSKMSGEDYNCIQYEDGSTLIQGPDFSVHDTRRDQSDG